MEIGLLIGLIVVALLAVGAFFLGGIFKKNSIEKEVGSVQERSHFSIVSSSYTPQKDLTAINLIFSGE